MRYVKPDYFDDFRCIAHQCPDTCCAGWQIMIDDASLEQYAQDKTAFASRFLKGINWEESCFVQSKGRCSMLNEQNLCDLVIEKGEEWLCETCSRYPRHVEEFEGVREWSLSLSCPVAAELMLHRTKPISFLTIEDDTEDPLEEEFEDFDFLLFTQLEDARKIIFDIVQNRALPIEQRKSIILEMAKQMQACVDENRLFDMDCLLEQYVKYGYENSRYLQEQDKPEMENCSKSMEYYNDHQRYMRLKKGFTYLERMERLREEWGAVLQETWQTLYCSGFDGYNEIYKMFTTEFEVDGAEPVQWEIFQENLLIFFLYTYFCGAVYDDWIYSKAAFAIYSVDFVQEFVMCRWFLADKHIDVRDCIELAYRYAREVEHSDENLDFLEECLNSEAT